MNELILLLLQIGVLLASTVEMEALVPVNHHIIAQIKSKTDKWQPYDLDENPFKDKTHAQLKRMLGLIQDSQEATSVIEDDDADTV